MTSLLFNGLSARFDEFAEFALHGRVHLIFAAIHFYQSRYLEINRLAVLTRLLLR